MPYFHHSCFHLVTQQICPGRVSHQPQERGPGGGFRAVDLEETHETGRFTGKNGETY